MKYSWRIVLAVNNSPEHAAREAQREAEASPPTYAIASASKIARVDRSRPHWLRASIHSAPGYLERGSRRGSRSRGRIARNGFLAIGQVDPFDRFQVINHLLQLLCGLCR